MDKLVYQALDMVDQGIIVVDQAMKIVFWNARIEKISKLLSKNTIGKHLEEICPVFAEDRYQNILFMALDKGQSRFCSSILHKAFIYPYGEDRLTSTLRQNMKVEPIDVEGERFVMLQLMDITNMFNSEREMKTLIKELEIAYVDIKSSEKVNKHLAHHDTLTGLLNRLAFLEKLSEAIYLAKIEGTQLAVLFLDLDGFKEINDTYGHECGDQILIIFAERLQSALRNKEIIARLGGDEFIIVIPNLMNEKEVAYTAARLIEVINAPCPINGNVVTSSVSIGISIFPADGIMADDLIKKADQAMYDVKNSGKNFYKFY